MLKALLAGAYSKSEFLGIAAANVPVTASLSDTGKAMGARGKKAKRSNQAFIGCDRSKGYCGTKLK